MPFTVQASGSIAALSKGPYSVQDALRAALQLRDQGMKNITLTDVETGIVLDIERFMRDHSDA